MEGGGTFAVKINFGFFPVLCPVICVSVHRDDRGDVLGADATVTGFPYLGADYGSPC